MTNQELIIRLEHFDACKESIDFVRDHGGNAGEVWQDCKRGDWMVWIAARVFPKMDRKVFLAKALIAKQVLHEMKDERSKKAVLMAEAYGRGEGEYDRSISAAATTTTTAAAAYAAAAAAAAAAYAAYAYAYAAAAAADAAAAAYAAYADDADAARKNSLENSANIVREVIPFSMILKLIS